MKKNDQGRYWYDRLGSWVRADENELGGFVGGLFLALHIQLIFIVVILASNIYIYIWEKSHWWTGRNTP